MKGYCHNEILKLTLEKTLRISTHQFHHHILWNQLSEQQTQAHCSQSHTNCSGYVSTAIGGGRSSCDLRDLHTSDPTMHATRSSCDNMQNFEERKKVKGKVRIKKIGEGADDGVVRAGEVKHLSKVTMYLRSKQEHS